MDERDYKAMNEEIKHEQMTLEKQLEYLGFEVYDYPTFRYELDNCYLVVDCNNGYTLIEDRGDEIVRGCKTIESITNLLRALQC